MQDVVQLGMSEELSEVMEGVSAGDKVKLTFEVTVSEIDEERFKATIDMLDSDISVIGGSEEDDEEDYEPQVEEEEEEYEEYDDEEE